MICKNFQHLLPDACPPQTSKDDRSQCCISPLSTWKAPSGYFLVISFEVKFGGRSDLVFSVQETAGIFTTNLSTTTFVLYLTIEGIFCCQNNYAFWFFFFFFSPTTFNVHFERSYVIGMDISNSYWPTQRKELFVLCQ